MSTKVCKYVSTVLLRGNKILLIRREHEPYAGKWSIPGGHVEGKESIDQAMVRELKQQTGYVANKRVSAYVAPFHDSLKPLPHDLIVAAWTAAQEKVKPQENIQQLWASPEQIESLGEENLTPDLLPIIRRVLETTT